MVILVSVIRTNITIISKLGCMWMVKIYLINEDGNTICRSKVQVSGSHSIGISNKIDILFYSIKLIDMDRRLQRRFIEDLTELNEIKPWYFSKVIVSKYSLDQKLEMIVKELTEIYENIAAKYGLEVKVKNNILY